MNPVISHIIFSIIKGSNCDDKKIENIIKGNTIAIMMPYVRSELTLLTAQPGVESVVLPAFNINKMFEDNK